MFGIFFLFKFIVNISNSRDIDTVHEEYKKKLKEQEAFHRKQIQQQQLYVEDLKQQILRGQVKAERELENDQALINQQILESKYLSLSHFPSITAFFHSLDVFVLVKLCVVVEVLLLYFCCVFCCCYCFLQHSTNLL